MVIGDGSVSGDIKSSLLTAYNYLNGISIIQEKTLSQPMSASMPTRKSTS